MENDKNPHEGHRKRLKERFLKTGLESFQPHEILELLLFYTRPRVDTNKLAHRLIDTFGSFSGVFDADVKKLSEISGVGENGAVLIKMIPQIMRIYGIENAVNDKLDTSKKVCNYFFNCFRGIENEQLRIACLNDNLMVVASGVIIEGGRSFIPFNMRKIVEFTYDSKCEMIILAHNHPNGNAVPSQNDIKTTNYIYPVLKDVGIKLLDHVIVTKDTATSMYDTGYFSTFI